MRRGTTATAWVRGVVDAFAAEGLDVGSLLTEAGIDPASLKDPAGRVPTEQISRLWELAAKQSGNEAIGLLQHQVARPASFDVVGYTMMSCANLLEAFERLMRYLLILSDALTMAVSEERGGYRVTFELFGGSRPVPRQRVEFILVSVIRFCQWISGRAFQPLVVELPYATPADPAPYRDAFGCRLTFDTPGCCIVFAQGDMTAPLPTSNPVLAELHERFAGEYLQRFDHAHTSHRAREAIIRRLPDGEPRRDEIARALCLSERTLQRRLEAEATSFAELLDDTRRELAEQYLSRLQLSLAQAAFLLGFVDQSSFFRACKRWFEVSPGQYRNQLLSHALNRSGS
jgi:AraC-like DNA-binding protein